ncbi:MAG: ABC transporter substrate-binding protein [Rhizobiales bacterium]|nr:ABC transporter substrate-binding protein [Hyphomicrobiales bacterium]
MTRTAWKAATIAVALLAGTATTYAQEELKIGAIGSLSGGGTAWGLALQRGVTLAIDEATKAGGLKIGGKTYMPKLVMYDDQYTATGGKTAADRLVNLDKVKYIIGPIGSPPVLASVAVSSPAKVIQLSNGFAPAILKNDAKSPYNFRVMNSNVEFGPAMIKWLHKNYPAIKKVALIAPNDAVGQAVIPTLVEAYKANGIEVWTEMYDRGMKEFTPLLTRMMAQNVDLFDLNSNAPGEAGLLLKQARQAGYQKMIWQVGGPSVDEIINVAGPLADGFLSYETFDFSSPQAQAFDKAYHAKWDGIINAQAPGWYNAAKILFKAMETAGSTDVTAVRDALMKVEGYDSGMYGPVIWGGQADYGVAHQLLLPFWIVEVKNGKSTIRDKLTPEKR